MKLRLSDLNLMVGMGWDKPDNAFIRFEFDTDDDNGPIVRVAIKDWQTVFPIDEAHTGEYAFWLGDCRSLIRKVEPYYVNFHAVINFITDEKTWEVVGGPGNGIKLVGI